MPSGRKRPAVVPGWIVALFWRGLHPPRYPLRILSRHAVQIARSLDETSKGKMHMNKIAVALASAGALALAACSEAPEETAAEVDAAAMADQEANADTAAAGSIVEVAQGNPDFSTLVAAVTAADLGTTLSGPGPYTVFAPTNAAFEKVPQATRDMLLSPAGKEDLTGILTYHVVSGETMSSALTQAIAGAGAEGAKLTTVNGAVLTAKADGGTVTLTDAAGNVATVTRTDIDASNGVIHVIDTVLMPQ